MKIIWNIEADLKRCKMREDQVRTILKSLYKTARKEMQSLVDKEEILVV